MQPEQIRTFVMRFFEVTQSKIIESTPEYIIVKLSPEADKALTNRTYYWSFVERTHVEPETKTYKFTFQSDAPQEAQPAPPASGNPQSSTSILERYLGTPVAPIQRIQQFPLTYGSAKLEQIFQTTYQEGKYVHLYEQMSENGHQRIGSIPYTSWLGVNYKIAWVCDQKKTALRSYGISLSTGEIVTQFQQQLNQRELSPRLPAHRHVKETISLERAVRELEKKLEQEMKEDDVSWAKEARERMNQELARIEQFYSDSTLNKENEQQEMDEQLVLKKEEIRWQYEPKIQISVINCGIFHLLTEPAPQYDASRFKPAKTV